MPVTTSYFIKTAITSGTTTYIDTEKGGIETFWGGKTHFELLNEETLEAIDRIMEGEYLSIIGRCV